MYNATYINETHPMLIRLQLM
ncbi:TPA: hypothetical protein ACOSHI_004826, partial [Salmonella enterica]